MTALIGLDVGGTKVAGRLYEFDESGDGSFADVEGFHFPSQRCGRKLLDALVAAVADVVDRHGLAPASVPIGIGICELVDREHRITSAAAVDWLGLDVFAAFGDHPLSIESDVRAAALAEARFGAGATSPDFVYISVGTGISFTHVLEGVPRAGHRGNALIIGAPPVEHVSAGPAIAIAAGSETAQDAFSDPGHQPVIDHAAQQLGASMAWLANALDPELIVVGGGLGLNDRYRQAAIAAMRPLIEAPTTSTIAVVPAATGQHSGTLGAALLAADDRGKR